MRSFALDFSCLFQFQILWPTTSTSYQNTAILLLCLYPKLQFLHGHFHSEAAQKSCRPCARIWGTENVYFKGSHWPTTALFSSTERADSLQGPVLALWGLSTWFHIQESQSWKGLTHTAQCRAQSLPTLALWRDRWPLPPWSPLTIPPQSLPKPFLSLSQGEPGAQSCHFSFIFTRSPPCMGMTQGAWNKCWWASTSEILTHWPAGTCKGL